MIIGVHRESYDVINIVISLAVAVRICNTRNLLQQTPLVWLLLFLSAGTGGSKTPHELVLSCNTVEYLVGDDALFPCVAIVARNRQTQIHGVLVGFVYFPFFIHIGSRLTGEKPCILAVDVEIKDRAGAVIDHVGGIGVAVATNLSRCNSCSRLPRLAAVRGALLHNRILVWRISARTFDLLADLTRTWAGIVGGKNIAILSNCNSRDSHVVIRISLCNHRQITQN
ncbi:Uncharacterised protein [Chlamydia trachomatis]|nr:Uncharacterised protein [Chlamydia trachomatis]